MARLSLTLLGGFQARLGGEVLNTFESNKVRGLLAYLAAEADRPQRREALAALLWQDWPQQSALRNLSYALADLRKNLGDREAKPPFLLISRDTLQINPQSDLEVDLWDFSSQLSAINAMPLPLSGIPTAFQAAGRVRTPDHLMDGSAGQQSATPAPPQVRVDNFKSAIDLYQGRFLEGFSLPDSTPFEEWLAASREVYQRQALQTLHSLAEIYEAQGEYAPGLVYARRQLELEPWREESHQQVMRLFTLSGQRGSALAQYETCCRLLKEQLNVEPGPETVRLYEAVRDGTLGQGEVGKGIEEQPPAPGAPPFKGLQYFDVTDAGLFFGREALTRELVNQIWEMVAYRGSGDEQGGCCFLAVVGASGSGKSSVVRAGLVAALQNSQALPADSSRWPVHVITPTAHPLEALAGSLTRGSESVTATATLIDDMGRDERSLHLYVNRLLGQAGPDGRHSDYLLLVIDQLEELFTLCRSEAESAAFINNLLHASHGPALVVITLRADFYAQCARYLGLRQALCTRQEYIGPMTSEELRRAIEEPARQGGWEFEAGLVDLILRDMGDEPGALPLLEHALLETWQRRSGRMLTLKGYAAAGGVQGAIAHTADAVYERLSGEQQGLARRIFLRLTELGEGTQDTRRRAALSELIPETDEGLAVKNLLKTLADARLVTLSEDSAEVAHEALIREWPALRAWLSEDRESLRVHRRLTEAALGWEKLSKDRGELYRGARLAQTLEWAAQTGHAGELNALELAFLNTSQVQAEGEAREREAQRQRELEAAQKLAEIERHSSSRLRRRAIYLVGVAGFAIILMVAAAVIAVVANNNARQATARQYASAALGKLATDPGQSISLALQSLQAEPSVDAYSALHQALFANHLRSRLFTNQGKVYGMAVSPDGSRLATIGTDRVLKVWQVNGATIEQPPVLSIPDIGVNVDQLDTYLYFNHSIYNPVFYDLLSFSPDGKYLAAVNNLTEIVLLDVLSGALEGRVDLGDQGKGPTIYTMAFSPNSSSQNGYWLAASTGPETMVGNLWIIKVGGGDDRIVDSQVAHFTLLDLAFRPDGTLVTAGYNSVYNGEVKLWRLPTTRSDFSDFKPGVWDQTLLKGIQYNPVAFISLSPDGSQVVFRTNTEAQIMDLAPLASGAPPVDSTIIPFENEPSYWNTTVFFLPGRNRLARANWRGQITLFDGVTGQPLFTPTEPEKGLITLAVSPVNQVLFTAHDTGELCSWDVSAPGSPEWLAVRTGGVRSGVILSPNGADLLSYNVPDFYLGKYEFTRWSINHQQILPLAEFSSEIVPTPFFTFRFSAARVALGINYPNPKIRVQEALTGKLIRDLSPGPGISDFTLSSDGSRIYFARVYGKVDVWDVDAGSQLNYFWVSSDKANNIYLNLSSDGTRLLTWGFRDKTVRLWDAASGQPIQEFSATNSTVCNPTLSPDNRFLVTCGSDHTAVVWEVASGKLARSIQLPDAPNYVQFSPDGRYLLVSLISYRTAVYDFANGRELVVLPGASTSIDVVQMGYQFSPDSRNVMITFPADHTAYGFVLDNNELVKLACQQFAAITLPGADGVVPHLPICETTTKNP